MSIQVKAAVVCAIVSGCALFHSCATMAEETQNDVNYGDPTASYRGLGVQRTNDGTQASLVFGTGEHIASADFGLQDNGKDYNYRVRYFNVDQDNGFGLSVDFIGGKTSDTTSTGLLGGMVQKFELSPNVMLVPMLAAGKVGAQDNGHQVDSWIAQPGLYAMYGFDAGHWLYANPKATYVYEAKDWTNEIELGGGYMLTDESSIGFKHELSIVNGKTDSKTWVNLYYYF
ncbi:hypothetical protein [Vibrio nigripulchritudo]|uniref:hypothetical protein n=1 Tax=Vibrio nigripulchritudo TaxID=28173 RepID=UPI0003B22584|nr:hypothetical protein [Vibrio nigripulchritudo]CCN68715.1 conserved exported hypothetical protein [Vibrio nigripulchritudo SFn118]